MTSRQQTTYSIRKGKGKKFYFPKGKVSFRFDYIPAVIFDTSASENYEKFVFPGGLLVREFKRNKKWLETNIIFSVNNFYG